MATFANSVWGIYEKQISSRFQPLLWLMSLRCFSPMEEKICLNIVVWQVHFGQFMQKIKAFHEKFTEWKISLHLRKFGPLITSEVWRHNKTDFISLIKSMMTWQWDMPRSIWQISRAINRIDAESSLVFLSKWDDWCRELKWKNRSRRRRRRRRRASFRCQCHHRRCVWTPSDYTWSR